MAITVSSFQDWPYPTSSQILNNNSLAECDAIGTRESFVLSKNVLITSTGYGVINDVKKKTSTLRHYFEEIETLDYKLIEPVSKEVFGISNEYWISFTANGQLFDKQYVFLPESIIEANFQMIPFIDKKGVIINQGAIAWVL